MSKNPQCPDMFSFVILVTILKMVCVAEKNKSDYNCVVIRS